MMRDCQHITQCDCGLCALLKSQAISIFTSPITDRKWFSLNVLGANVAEVGKARPTGNNTSPSAPPSKARQR